MQMKMKLFNVAMVVCLVFAVTLPGSIEKDLELPLGTQMEKPAPDRLILALPDGRRLELTGGGDILAGFQGCTLTDSSGKVVQRGMRVRFVNPSMEKMVTLPAGVRLVAIENELVWARQGAPVPPGSYLMFETQVIWLPAKLSYLASSTQSHPQPPPRKIPAQPK